MSQQLLACGRLLRVLSFCRNDSTLLLMGRLVGVWPAAAEADVLVLLCCCWTHCCEDAAGQMGAQKDMSAHLRFWEQTNGTYTMQHPPPHTVTCAVAAVLLGAACRTCLPPLPQGILEAAGCRLLIISPMQQTAARASCIASRAAVSPRLVAGTGVLRCGAAFST